MVCLPERSVTPRQAMKALSPNTNVSPDPFSLFLSSPSSHYVNPKVYLIVIFVGLLVVVILAVMLSAWCCKGEQPQFLLFLSCLTKVYQKPTGAFKNPCCCPCYLCACCGGLGAFLTLVFL